MSEREAASRFIDNIMLSKPVWPAAVLVYYFVASVSGKNEGCWKPEIEAKESR